MASGHVIWSQNNWVKKKKKKYNWVSDPYLPDTDMDVLTLLKLGFIVLQRGLIIHSLYNSELFFFLTLNFLIIVLTMFSYILCHFAR